MPAEAEKPYLAVCAIYRWEAPYLREWVAFHRLMGVRAVLPLRQPQRRRAPRGARAVHRGRHGRRCTDWPEFPGQGRPTTTASSATARTRAGSRSSTSTSSCSRPPAGRCPRCCADYERWPGVGVNRAMFGNVRPRDHAAGPRARELRPPARPARAEPAVKSIVDPARAVRPDQRASLRATATGAGGGRERAASSKAWSRGRSLRVLRVNHYFTQSEEEALRKFTARSRRRASCARAEARGAAAPQRALRRAGRSIQRWLPGLRAELERIEKGE